MRPNRRSPKAKPAAAGRRAVEPARRFARRGRRRDAGGAVRRRGGRDSGSWPRAEKDRPTRGYLALVEGIAQRLGGKADAARETLAAALKAAPEGPWAAKIRQELAGVLLAAGKVAEAEALARGQAEALLAGDRKDRLAEVYHAFARRLLKPDDPVTPADPKAAYDLLAQARALAKGETLRARLLFAQARAAQAFNDRAQAVADFQAYLKEYPKGADRLDARYRLGEAQRASGQHLQARLTWTDLARDLDDPKAAPRTGPKGSAPEPFTGSP